MLILCPNCATSYDIDMAMVGTTGRSVRCVRCKTIWFAAPPSAGMPVATARMAEVLAEAEAAFDVPLPDEVGEELVAAGDFEIVMTEDVAAESPDDVEALPVAASPTLVPTPDNARPKAAGPPDNSATVDIETIAARRARRNATRRRRSSTASRMAALIVILAAVNASLIVLRANIVAVLPQTAALYAAIGLPVNLRDLAFTDLKSTSDTVDGVPVLTVQGTIVSLSSKPVDIPRLRFSARNTEGREVYSWTALPEHNRLAAGDTLPFHTRLASPPADIRDVAVRFFTHHDLATGFQ